MCTVILLIRPNHNWPLCIAANRDEMLNRAWDPPGPYWPGIVAGRDRAAGGTWLGLNDRGVVAAVLNRPGSLGPAPGKRSRGELPLLALQHPTAAGAAEAIAALKAAEYRSFNLVLADRSGAIFIRGLGHGHPEALPLNPGLHMITAHDPDDETSPRVARYLPCFSTAPGPDEDDWAAWRALISDRSGDAHEQINVTPRGGFGTVCTSLIALPVNGPPEWLFAPGAPDQARFERVTATQAAAALLPLYPPPARSS